MNRRSCRRTPAALASVHHNLANWQFSTMMMQPFYCSVHCSLHTFVAVLVLGTVVSAAENALPSEPDVGLSPTSMVVATGLDDPLEELPPTFEAWKSLLHPDDIPMNFQVIYGPVLA